MYIKYSCTSNDYCLSYFGDVIAASACDVLCNCFFSNKLISYNKFVQLYFCRHICRSINIFDNFTVNTNL